MAFYNSPEEMYKARASRFKKDGDIHWAKAKKRRWRLSLWKSKKML